MGTFAVASRNAMLGAYCGGTAYSGNAAVYVKLHLGDPGADGTASPAANTTRQQVTWTSISAGAISNQAALEWTNVPNTETYTYVSLWNHATAGTFLGSDDLSSSAAMNAGDTFRIVAGDLDVTIS